MGHANHDLWFTRKKKKKIHVLLTKEICVTISKTVIGNGIGTMMVMCNDTMIIEHPERH